ncbi:MAG: hypothetical protein O2847_01395 [Actinomycetota bacterium]|nr:hypothetical protein [Actinomycetota bacterium]
MTSTEQKLETDYRRLFALFNLSFALIATSLAGYMVLGDPISKALRRFAFFSKLDPTEISDRMTVILLLLICTIGFIALPRILSLRYVVESQNLIAVYSTALLILSFGWRWGDEMFESLGTRLWFGWGDKLALVLLFIGVVCVFLITSKLLPMVTYGGLNSYSLNFVAAIVFAIYYLPSFIQPFNGLIELHHSKYILNDLLIQASGKWPYNEVMPQYVGLLGLPLKLITFISPSFTVNSALLWVNFLVISEVTILALITKNVLGLKSWGVALMATTSVVFIKVQPNQEIWGSIAQHMNLVPARTILPLILLFTLLRLNKAEIRSASIRSAVTVGVVAGITAFNNPEFGIPATVAVIIILTALLSSHKITPRIFSITVVSTLVTFGSIFFIYALFGDALQVSTWLAMIQVHGFDGYMNLPMPDFGLWIFFYSTLGTSAIIGTLALFGKGLLHQLKAKDSSTAIVLAFAGLWGSATLFYFTGRSLVPEIVVFLIPLSLAIVSYIQILRNSHLLENPPSRARSSLSILPIFLVALIPLVSLFSAPNPAFEWRRVTGHGERWSAARLTEPPGFTEMRELVRKDQDNEYLFFGNNGPAIQILSNIENGLGIISLEDISINPLMAEIACKQLARSDADYVISPRADWPDDWEYNSPPCPRMKLVRFNDDSELLIFALSAKD